MRFCVLTFLGFLHILKRFGMNEHIKGPKGLPNLLFKLITDAVDTAQRHTAVEEQVHMRSL